MDPSSRQDLDLLKARESQDGSKLWSFIFGGVFFEILYLAVSFLSQIRKNTDGVKKKYQETETQDVDALPECESQEQDPANEQVCREKPLSEIDIYVGKKSINSQKLFKY